MAFLHWVEDALVSGAVLQWLTIVVLILAMIAAWKQAKAAEKLTEATERQIQTATEQANAAKEQVAVVRRQVTESLRPILVLANSPAPGRNGTAAELGLTLRNDGLGVALDVWWRYGDAKGKIDGSVIPLGNGIIPPKTESTFIVQESALIANGVLVVYESLAGVASATRITWASSRYHVDYLPDITEWAGQLLKERHSQQMV